MNEPPKTWACGHASPAELFRTDWISADRPAWKVEWGKRCPVCNLSYSEYKALTERNTK